jgi:hypothetical protein
VIAGSYEGGAMVDPATGEVSALVASRSIARYPAQVVDELVTVGDRVLGSGGRWADAAPIPGSRELPGTAVHDGRLYVWGGSGCTGGMGCSGFLEASPAGLVWTPPGSAPPREPKPTVPGEAVLELTARMTCGPTDATEIELHMTSAQDRTVSAEVVRFDNSGATLLGGPETFELPAGTEVADFVAFNVRVDEVQAAGQPLTARVKDPGSEAVLAAYIVPIETPSCG